MSLDAALVLAIVAGALFLFATERLPVDLVALGVCGVLLALGLVTPGEGLSGFSNPATITIAAMFVVSAGLQQTGALRVVTRLLIRVGDRPFALLVPMMLMAALASAFINNTSLVAVALPLVLAVCARHRIAPSKLLIPLSFASQFGGVCTLVGTSTNLLVSALSDRAGHGPFAMFEFAGLGAILVLVGTLYFVVAGYWMLPERFGGELTESYRLKDYMTELRVTAESTLVGKTVSESKLADEGVRVIEILRERRKIWSPGRETLRAGDILLVQGRMEDFMALKDGLSLAIEPEFRLKDETLAQDDQRLVEALVAPRSQLAGQSLTEVRFAQKHGLVVLAIHQREATLRRQLSKARLRVGDTLLLLGPKDEVERLRTDEDFIFLDEVQEPSMRKGKARTLLGIAGLVVLAASLGVLPILTAAILGAVAMVATRCIRIEEAYEAVDWKVVLLLAGVVPLGIAIEKSGAAGLIVTQTLHWVGDFGAPGALAVVYLLTLILTEFLSNSASAALMVPIAISTAVGLGVEAKPFLMAVTFAASVNFATPVGYQTNLMVYSPGGYRYADFLKVGIPLDLLFAVLSVMLIPMFWPF